MPGPLHARAALLPLLWVALIAPPCDASAEGSAVGDWCRGHPGSCVDGPASTPTWVRRAPPNDLPASRGWQVGLKMGVAHPGGTLGAGSAATTPRLSDVAETWVPIGFDAGYRLSPGAYLGASVLWGGTFGNDNGLCAACGFRYDFQALTDLRFYPAARATVNPWLAFGFGWEVMHLNFEGAPSGASATYHGPVLANLQVGLDLRKGAFAIGPYFGVALAEFALRSLTPSPPGEPTSGFDRTIHEWFTLGLRASYGPW